MKRETYVGMVEGLRAKPHLARAIVISNSIITKAIYVAYPHLLIYLFIQQFLGFTGALGFLSSPDLAPTTLTLESFFTSAFFKALSVPFVAFVLLSVFRSRVNAPRPYEVFDAKPVISKDSKGKSFPSRHVFSIFLIATTFLAVCPNAAFGLVIEALGIALAAIRVMAGVHFPRDVIMGALLGIFAGSFEFLI